MFMEHSLYFNHGWVIFEPIVSCVGSYLVCHTDGGCSVGTYAGDSYPPRTLRQHGSYPISITIPSVYRHEKDLSDKINSLTFALQQKVTSIR